jgi:hypothetical protein
MRGRGRIGSVSGVEPEVLAHAGQRRAILLAAGGLLGLDDVVRGRDDDPEMSELRKGAVESLCIASLGGDGDVEVRGCTSPASKLRRNATDNTNSTPLRTSAWSS